MNDYTIRDFRAGDRVQVHPATDLWMMGDRYGAVVRVGRSVLTVKMDRSGRSVRIAPADICEINDPIHGVI